MRKLSKQTIKRERKILNGLLYFCLFFLALGTVYRSSARIDSEGLLSVIEQAPVQTETTRPPFEIKKLGREYFIEPVFDYELWGVVVSKNRMNSIFDRHNIKHEVRIQDFCVIWGENAFNNITESVGVRSENYTCYFYPKDGAVDWGQIHFDQIANNHLLATNKKVIHTIKNIEIGDQIHVQGVLANYGRAGTEQYIRKSSTIRTDQGDGACETVFVDQIEILKRRNPIMGWLVHNAKYLFLFFFGGRVLLEFFKKPARQLNHDSKTGFEVFDTNIDPKNPPKKSTEPVYEKPQDISMFARGIKSGLLPDYPDKKQDE